jgi:ABC-2 type transport system ATP-binding protein
MSTTTPSAATRLPEHAAATAVSLDGLSKRYGSRVAVDNLTFSLPRGVVAGFIGPNGAGKTTTMAMLLGLVAPTSGTASVLGRPLDRPAAYLGRVGALIESPAFWPSLTGDENLRLLARLAGHDPGQVGEVLARVGLEDRATSRFGEYSLGMKQRLGIAAALLGDPQLLILDEPTNGLDPAGMNEMRQLLASLSRDDRTILVSSHLLSEVEHVCDWLVVIERGRLVYQGDRGGFLGDGATNLVLATEHDADVDRVALLLRAEGYEAAIEADRLVVPVDANDERRLAANINRLAFDEGIALAEISVRRPTLESHYLSIVEGGER